MVEQHQSIEHLYSAAVQVILICAHILFMVFLLYILLRFEHRRILRYQLAANLTLGHLPAALFIWAEYIRTEFFNFAVPLDYCMFQEYISVIFEVSLPWMLFMFSIDRLMFIHDPASYDSKISRCGAIALVLFPWIFSILLAVGTIAPFEYHMTNYELITAGGKNFTDHYCDYDDEKMEVQVRFIVGTDVPFLMSAIVLVTVIVIWCIYKHEYKNDIVEDVRNSVIAVVVLNGLGVVGTVLMNMDLVSPEYTEITSNFVEGTLWMTTLPLVKAKLVDLGRLCCCRTTAKKSEPYASDNLAYTPDNVAELGV